ncbi:MAG TPA: energy transducer TonB [Prolixibacteraceae bacterium]|nr:energy transducer TonB [Prolixibacteraceae bacterium]
MKSISRKASYWKSMTFLPLLALLLMSFGTKSGSESISTQSQKAASTQKAAPAKATPAQGDEKVYIIVDVKPEFPGGQKAMSEYFSKNFKYPKNAEAKGIQGKVYVSFVITKEGKITKAKIWKSVDPELDAEALRLIQQMPNWVPGKKKGVVVNTAYNLPVNFTLSK